MPPRSATLAAFALALLMVGHLPLASAHDDHGDPNAPVEPEPEARPLAGYTGPSIVPYLSYFEGVPLYGRFSWSRIADQDPRDMKGDGDWLVWEDANRSDIHVYSISAGDGFYIARDPFIQHNPAISNNVVVWEDYRDFHRPDIYAYFLDTGETRRVSTGGGNNRNPSIHGSIVAWETDRNGDLDIYAASLITGREFRVATSTDRETDALVMGDNVYYRTYRFNVWDIMGYSIRHNETFSITSDVAINGAPFGNGKDVLFVSQSQVGWTLHRYETLRDRVIPTPLKFSDAAPRTASGDGLLQIAYEAGYHQVVARNLTSGASSHITGNLLLNTEPLLLGRTAYFMVRTANGTALLVLDVSSFAFSKTPTLTVSSPSSGAPWVRPLTIQGSLQAGPEWTEPQTFTYRLNDEPPRAIPPGKAWRFSLDPAGYEPGVHLVVIRATFRDGPPVETVLTLIVPSAFPRLDVEEAAGQFHRARVLSAYRLYVGENPAGWLLIPLVLALVALILFRIWLAWRASRRPVIVEFVRPR